MTVVICHQDYLFVPMQSATIANIQAKYDKHDSLDKYFKPDISQYRVH
jgi:hypothetical protein